MNTKLAAALVVGDCICYRSGDLQNPACYPNRFIPLSGTILSIIDLADDKLEITTVTGRLKVCEKTKVFELEKESLKGHRQMQYTIDPAETFMGVSIE